MGIPKDYQDLPSLAAHATRLQRMARVLTDLGVLLASVAAIVVLHQTAPRFSVAIAPVAFAGALSAIAFVSLSQRAGQITRYVREQIEVRQERVMQGLPAEYRLQVPMVLQALARRDIRSIAQQSMRSIPGSQRFMPLLEGEGLVQQDRPSRRWTVPPELEDYLACIPESARPISG